MGHIICQTCLKSGDDVSPMTTNDLKMYQRIVTNVPNNTMFICVFCRKFLWKIIKFIDLCHKAQEIILEQVAPKLLHFQIKCFNLSISATETSYVGPEKSSHLNIKEEQSNTDNRMRCKLEERNEYLLPSSPKLRIQYKNFTVSTPETFYLGPEAEVGLNFKEENSNSIFDSNEAYVMESEDDVPLVLFCGNEQSMCEPPMSEDKDSLKDIVFIKTNDNIIEDLKVEDVENTKKHRTKMKKANMKKEKVLREGFTSRMVQETTEYVVIKLTKEQVLEEMKERQRDDKYLRAPYKCEKCVKGFNFEDVLQSHMEKHSMKNGLLQCELCTQHCPSTVSLRGHMKSHTTRYKCKICGYIRLSRQHVLEHYSIVHSNPTVATYSCEQCVFTTNKRTVMQRHVRMHERSEPHACPRCGKLFKSVESLRVHTMRHDNKKKFQCDQCNQSFVYPTLLHKHVQSVHVRRDYYCVECDIKFKSMDTLKLHFKRAKRHRDTSSFKHECDACGQRFPSAASLAAHGATSHGAARLHACGACPRAYSGRDALRAHVRRAHRPPAPAPASDPQPDNILRCPLCDRSFARKSVLEAHARTHSGERPFACEECGAAFAQPATLRTHRTAKHEK